MREIPHLQRASDKLPLPLRTSATVIASPSLSPKALRPICRRSAWGKANLREGREHLNRMRSGRGHKLESGMRWGVSLATILAASGVPAAEQPLPLREQLLDLELNLAFHRAGDDAG
jgi:hypothetical protein